MNRSFPKAVQQKRLVLQKSQCALCNMHLTKRSQWQAHHIDGDGYNHRLSNCAIVCRTPCHLQAHCGNWSGEYVLSKSNFRLTRKKKSRISKEPTLSQYKNARKKFRNQGRNLYKTTNGITATQIFRVLSMDKKNLQSMKRNGDFFAALELAARTNRLRL